MKLRAENLSVRLGQRLVLDRVRFDLSAGEMVAVIGPNGAGKSTLLRALSGLVPLSSGRVLLDDRDVAGMCKTELGRQLAFIPQDRAVHWPLPVERVVGLGRLPHAPSTHDRVAIAAALKAMDLEGLAKRRVSELSGGELARVLQARALAQEADILIADEPTAGLDMGHVLQLLGLLKGLVAAGRSVIVAVHDVSLALRFCHRTILLCEGKVLAQGASDEVVTSQHLAHAFGVAVRIETLDNVPIVLATSTLT